MANTNKINYTVTHPDFDLTLSWGDAFNAPIIWDEDNMPSIDPEFLRERGW